MRKVLALILGFYVMDQVVTQSAGRTASLSEHANGLGFLAVKVLLAWAAFRICCRIVSGATSMTRRGVTRAISGTTNLAGRALASVGTTPTTTQPAGPATGKGEQPAQVAINVVALHPCDMYPTGVSYPAFFGSAAMVDENTPAEELASLYAFANASGEQESDETMEFPALAA